MGRGSLTSAHADWFSSQGTSGHQSASHQACQPGPQVYRTQKQKPELVGSRILRTQLAEKFLSHSGDLAIVLTSKLREEFIHREPSHVHGYKRGYAFITRWWYLSLHVHWQTSNDTLCYGVNPNANLFIVLFVLAISFEVLQLTCKRGSNSPRLCRSLLIVLPLETHVSLLESLSVCAQILRLHYCPGGWSVSSYHPLLVPGHWLHGRRC